jgi:hypothetical protein
LTIVAAVAVFLLVPAGGPTGATSQSGYDVRHVASDVSAAKKTKKARKAPKKEEYMRAAPSEPPPGAKK